MNDTELMAAAAQWHDAAATLAAAFSASQRSGGVCTEVLAEVVAGTRQGELMTCLANERTDRSGEFAHNGAVSAVAYLRTAANETGPWAGMRTTTGRALVDYLPATRAAWARGDLGLAHAWEIVRATKDIKDNPDLVARLDEILAAATPALSPEDLKSLGDRIRAQEAPDPTAKRNADHKARQKLTMAKTMDGSWDLHARLDAEQGAVVHRVLDAFTTRPTADEVLADPAGAQPYGERRADALVEICRQAAAHAEHCGSATSHYSGTARGSMIVAIPLADLQSARGLADVAGGGLLPAAAARRWACDAGIIPMVLGSRSEILDYGTRTRIISDPLRIYLAARDGGCLGPGCDRPPSWCEGHHRRHWLDGGPTNPENLDLFCTRHHHMLHEGGWTYTRQGTQTLLFQPPNGKPPITTKRRPLIRIPMPRSRPAATRDSPSRR